MWLSDNFWNVGSLGALPRRPVVTDPQFSPLACKSWGDLLKCHVFFQYSFQCHLPCPGAGSNNGVNYRTLEKQFSLCSIFCYLIQLAPPSNINEVLCRDKLAKLCQCKCSVQVIWPFRETAVMVFSLEYTLEVNTIMMGSLSVN